MGIPFVNKLSCTERGNCCYWVSKALTVAGVIPSPTMYPKLLFISLYFRFFSPNPPQFFEKPTLPKSFFTPENANIVAYKKQDAFENDPRDDSWIAPSFLFSPTGRMFRALERFANLVVSIPSPKPQEPFKAITKLVSQPFRPFSKKKK